MLRYAICKRRTLDIQVACCAMYFASCMLRCVGLQATATQRELGPSPERCADRRYISFVYYGFGLLVHAEYQGREILSCVDPSLLTNPGAATVQVSSPGCWAAEMIVVVPVPTFII